MKKEKTEIDSEIFTGKLMMIVKRDCSGVGF